MPNKHEYMVNYYTLTEEKKLTLCTREEWAAWCDAHADERIIDRHVIANKVAVITFFTGYEVHTADDVGVKPRRCFETFAIGMSSGYDGCYYAGSYHDARKKHAELYERASNFVRNLPQ